MSVSLTTFLNAQGSNLMAPADLARALEETADAASTGTGKIDYMTFSGKRNAYSLGKDNADVDPDQYFLLGPQTFFGGWICWKDTVAVSRVEWLATRTHDQAVKKEDLKDYGPYRDKNGDGWHQQLGFQAITINKLKREIKFSTSSKSGRNAVGDMMKEVGARAVAAEPHIPLVRFERAPFTSQGMLNHKPVFVVDTWVTNEQATAYMEDDLTEAQLVNGATAKKKKKKKK